MSFLLIDKPSGITSFDVIRKLRQKLGVRKMGHAGTLDPIATGLLIIGVGHETKRLASLIGLNKEYEMTVRFGVTSDTYDREGKIVAQETAKEIPREKIEAALKNFIGETEQMPPKFSAKKIKGVSAYKLARAGQEVSLEPKNVKISSIEILDYSWPLLRLRVNCSSGTYMRSLAHDLGRSLGCGGIVEEIRRTRIGDFSVEKAVQLS